MNKPHNNGLKITPLPSAAPADQAKKALADKQKIQQAQQTVKK